MLGIARKMFSRLQSLREERRAVTALEFAMIVALIGMVVVTAMTGMGRGVAATFNHSGIGL